MVDGAREVCGFMRVGGTSLKNVQWNDVVKVGVERKGAAWREVLGVRDEVAKDRFTRKKKKGLKVYISEQKEGK